MKTGLKTQIIILAAAFLIAHNSRAESRFVYANPGPKARPLQASVTMNVTVIVPSFCSLVDSLRPHMPEPADPVDDPTIPVPPLKVVGKYYFLCNERQSRTLQIDPTNPEVPTPLTLSFYPNCKHASTAIHGLPFIAWEKAYVCSPKNYTPKPFEARVTLYLL